MNDQLYLLGATTMMIFMTLVVKKLSYTNWDHQVYHRKFPLIKFIGTLKMLGAGVVPTFVLLYFFEQSAYSGYALPYEFSIFIPLLGLPITWQLCSYEYNSFFNHWHWDLRLSILVLNTLIFYHPAFLPVYLVLVHFSNGQFTSGHGSYWTFSDKELPVFLLMCFCVYQFMRLVFSDPLFLPFVLSLITITAGHYTAAAVAKLRIGQYITKANIHDMITSSFIVGWKLLKDEDKLMKLSQRLAPISSLTAMAALIIELGGGFAIYQSEWLLAWIIVVFSFHVIVYVISGIFFWKWACTLALLFFFLKRTEVLPDFQGSVLIMAYVVVVSVLLYYSKQIFRPGWITISYAYRFHFWLQTAKGERFLLPPSFFKPYDMIFSQARFWFLSKKENRLASNVGSVTNTDLFSNFKALSGPDQLSDFRHTHGQSQYSSHKAKDFDRFVKTFVSNKVSCDCHVPKIFHPPRHLFYLSDWTLHLSNEDSPIRLTIELEEYYFSDNKICSNGGVLFHEIEFDNTKNNII